MFRPTTKATLSEIGSVTWFTSCGQPWNDSVLVLSSWEEAVESCQSDHWTWLTEEAASGLSQAIATKSKERFRSWNSVVNELKLLTVPLVKSKIWTVVAAFHLPQAFEDCVQWDVLHLLLEAEYSDLVKPAFFSSQAFWYLKGRFPCGWSGVFPQGKLVIF